MNIASILNYANQSQQQHRYHSQLNSSVDQITISYELELVEFMS